MASSYSASSLTASPLASSLTSSSLSADSIHKVNRILDMERYNGRVNVMDVPDGYGFQMSERISIKNKTSEYRDPMTGILEDNMLSKVYFSEGNVQILQNGLRAGVYEMSDRQIVLPPQNIDNLKIIMRSIYLQYAGHTNESITKQVQVLNRMVLDYVVPTLYNEALGYMKYREDQSTLVKPLARPLPADRVYKQLELKPWV